jgi:hypothetical protein
LNLVAAAQVKWNQTFASGHAGMDHNHYCYSPSSEPSRIVNDINITPEEISERQ